MLVVVWVLEVVLAVDSIGQVLVLLDCIQCSELALVLVVVELLGKDNMDCMDMVVDIEWELVLEVVGICFDLLEVDCMDYMGCFVVLALVLVQVLFHCYCTCYCCYCIELALEWEDLEWWVCY